MRTDNGQHPLWDPVMAIEEVLSGQQQSGHRFKELTMRDFAPEMAPEHFDGIEPRAIGRQVQQDQPASCTPNHSFNLIIFMGVGIVPGDVDCSGRVLVHQSLQQFGHFTTALSSLEQNDGFTRVIIHGTQPVSTVRLTWGGDHHLFTFGAPQCPQGRQPTDIEFIGIIEYVALFQLVAGVFNRLFLTRYSGSGLLILCWGRLSTMSAFFSTRRTVSVETRWPVFSAM